MVCCECIDMRKMDLISRVGAHQCYLAYYASDSTDDHIGIHNTTLACTECAYISISCSDRGLPGGHVLAFAAYVLDSDAYRLQM